VWVRVALTKDDVGGLFYANYPTWVELSAGTRRVRDGAAKVDAIAIPEVTESIPPVAPSDPSSHLSA
jgi:mRNA-degrading endonuclease toxin of MazEF toxin-antitoxin module